MLSGTSDWCTCLPGISSPVNDRWEIIMFACASNELIISSRRNLHYSNYRDKNQKKKIIDPLFSFNRRVYIFYLKDVSTLISGLTFVITAYSFQCMNNDPMYYSHLWPIFFRSSTFNDLLHGILPRVWIIPPNVHGLRVIY